MSEDKKPEAKSFDPNEGGRTLASGETAGILPSPESYAVGMPPVIPTAHQHMQLLEVGAASIPEPNSLVSWLGDALSKGWEALKKATTAPSLMSYGKITYMPDPSQNGVLPWPGIAAEAIKKIARENIAPQLIIGMRIDDVLRYSEYSE